MVHELEKRNQIQWRGDNGLLLLLLSNGRSAEPRMCRHAEGEVDDRNRKRVEAARHLDAFILCLRPHRAAADRIGNEGVAICLIGPDLSWSDGARAERVVVLFDEVVERRDEDLGLRSRVQGDETLCVVGL